MTPETASTVVTGVEMFRKLLDEGRRRQHRRAAPRREARGVQRGQVLAAPEVDHPHAEFGGAGAASSPRTRAGATRRSASKGLPPAVPASRLT